MVNIKKFLGFTRSGTSTLGKYIRALSPKNWIHRGVGVILVALATSTVLIHTLSNIGGPVILGTNNVSKPVIDATTKASIQTPLKYDSESRGFSWLHTGADLAAPIGTPVKSIMAGTVKETNNWIWGYGNHIIITHDQGFETIYGHLSKINVHIGDKVDLGTIIGEVGSTGFSTGPHLHLEVRQNGQLVNPADIVPGVN